MKCILKEYDITVIKSHDKYSSRQITSFFFFLTF